MYSNLLITSFVVTLLFTAQASQQFQGSSTAVFFQGYHWNSWSYQGWYNIVNAQVAAIANLSVTHVWLPPPANSGDSQGYLPRELNNFYSNYGTPSNLTALIAAFNHAGVGVVYDAVLNHRVGDANWCDFNNPAWPSWYTASGDEACNSICGGPAPSGCSNPNVSPNYPGCSSSGSDTGQNYCAARDLDYQDSTVLSTVQTYLCQLRADTTSSVYGNYGLGLNYTGIRFDFALGYSSSVANSFNSVWPGNSYCTANTAFTFHNLNASLDQTFCVAENWVSGLSLVSNCDAGDIYNAQQTLNSYANSVNCGVFDFVTKFALTCALNNNNFGLLHTVGGTPPGLIGINSQKSVTFVDNHDTGDADTMNSGQRLMAFNYDGSYSDYATTFSQAYAYILTHPGVPSIFYPHYFSWGNTALTNDIKTLSKIRHNTGITSDATVFICQAWSSGSGNLYAAYISPTGNGVYTVAMKIGSYYSWNPYFGQGTSTGTLLGSGNNWAVWQWTTGTTNPNCWGSQ